MKNKRISALTYTVLLFSVTTLSSCNQTLNNNLEDIVILYENDTHCVIEGYSKLASLKNELKETYKHVGVVSSGDFIQGNSLGAISQGEYIVNLMNLVGYDATALGNHEFDYRLERLNQLVEMMDTKPICCNFKEIDKEDSFLNHIL